MQKNTVWKLVLVAAAGTLGAILGANFVAGGTSQLLLMGGIVVLTIACCALIMHLNSAKVVSDPKKLKDLDDYRNALTAWLSEDTPFADQIRIAVNQLDSLERKQRALRSILDDSKDSPFRSTADEVDHYLLANSKRVLNRIMIYDGTDQNKYRMHVLYLQQILQQNARVLSDFENLILEVSQIGDDPTTETPCLRELTDALRSVRAPELPEEAPEQPFGTMQM